MLACAEPQTYSKHKHRAKIARRCILGLYLDRVNLGLSTRVQHGKKYRYEELPLLPGQLMRSGRQLRACRTTLPSSQPINRMGDHSDARA